MALTLSLHEHTKQNIHRDASVIVSYPMTVTLLNQDTLEVDFLVYKIFFKKSTYVFCAHDSCTETQTLVQPLRCMHAKMKNRQTDGQLRAVRAFLSSIFRKDTRISFSVLNFTIMNGMGANLHAACPPATVLPEKIHYEGKTAMQKRV